MLKISLIIPAHDETAVLPRLLDTVDEAGDRSSRDLDGEQRTLMEI